MAVNPNFTNANAATSFFSSGGGGGGGGSNVTFQTVNINQGGSITIGSSLNAGTDLLWNKDVSGAFQTYQSMKYYLTTSGIQNLVLYTYDQSGNLDRQVMGDVVCGGTNSTVYGGWSGLQIGSAGTNSLGTRLVNSQTGVIEATFQDINGTEQSLYNLSTINAGSDTANAILLMSSLKGTFPSCFS